MATAQQEQEDRESKQEREDRESKQAAQNALWTIVVALTAGLTVTFIFAIASSPWTAGLGRAVAGVMVAGASLALGCLLGFLFGVPRSLQGDHAPGVAGGVGYRANTNLEQISDWLTKILIGVGLTQLAAIPGHLRDVARYLAPGLGGSAPGEVFALVLVLYYLVGGFFLAYLWTRLYLGTILRAADTTALGAQIQAVTDKVDKVSSQVQNVESQTQRDTDAFDLVSKQLSAGTDSPDIDQAKLNEAVKAASTLMKIQIFNLAVNQRQQNWRADGNKALMERTIPVFRALIADDIAGRFHRNHGQLGYALKDQRKPAFEEAESELTKAIEIRTRTNERGFRMYEYNRAICRIMLDADYLAERPSSPEAFRRIAGDLEAAAGDRRLAQLLNQQETIMKWRQRNPSAPAAP